MLRNKFFTRLKKLHAYGEFAVKAAGNSFSSHALPYNLTFSITRRCLCRCKNCGIWRTPCAEELTLGEIRLISERSPWISWINITGGEPTDRDDFPEIAELFARNCSSLTLLNFSTNGLETDRICRFAAQISGLAIPVLVATVSIDGPPEIDDRLRGIEGHYQRAIDTYIGLSKTPNFDVYIGMTLYKENCTKVLETYRALSADIPGFKPCRLHVNLPHLSQHYYRNQYLQIPCQQELIRSLSALKHLCWSGMSPIQMMQFIYRYHAVRFLGSGKSPMPCSSLVASCFLDETGNLYPCSIWNRPLGNLRECDYSIESLLTTEGAYTARQVIIGGGCPNCWTPCEAATTIAAGILRPWRVLRRR